MPTTPRTPWEETVEKAMQACVDVFGEGKDENGDGKVTYTHAGGQPYKVDGIFEAQTEQIDPDTGAVVLSHQPMISFRLSKLQQLPDVGDSVTIRDQAYRVVEPMFDGQGTVTLRLHEV